jgi:predicted transcriptional regulator
MSTTTIRLPDELKARVAKVAEAAGVTPHGFIVEAIAAKAAEAEAQSQFDAEVAARWARFMETGEAIPWADMRQYILDKAAGRPVPRPKARKLGTPKAVARRA